MLHHNYWQRSNRVRPLLLDPVPRESGVIVLTISIYQPCDTPGASTTQQQKLRFLKHHNVELQRREALYEDLYMECAEWMKDDGQLIMRVNANRDVRTDAMAELLQALSP
jgi:hypothetical protein